MPTRNADDDQPLLPGLDDLDNPQARRYWGEEGFDDFDFPEAEHWPLDRYQR